MTKKIEITSHVAQLSVNEKLYALTNNNSLNPQGACEMYLMSGTVPFNSTGLVPWGFDVLVQNVDPEIPWSPLWEVPVGTYTGTSDWWWRGLTSTITLIVTENNQFNLQVNSTGNLSANFDWGSDWFFPINPLGVNISWDTPDGAQLPLTITFKTARSQDALVKWKNNRIKAGNGTLSTFAAAATASGTATWFFISNRDNRGTFAGTVGLTGSGADLELDDVNIVQGKTYGISNLRIQMPTVFEY